MEEERSLVNAARNCLEELRKENRLRVIPEEAPGEMADFLTNDYMGLASNADLPLCWEGLETDLKARYERLRGEMENPEARPGQMTASASRLLATRQAAATLLEDFLSEAYTKAQRHNHQPDLHSHNSHNPQNPQPSHNSHYSHSSQYSPSSHPKEKRALLFNSGYHANTGIIAALETLPKTIFLADKLMHASAYDGLFAARAKFDRFPHNDLGKLRRLLEKHSQDHDHIVVITESVFSMDGDLAPLEELALLRREFPAMALYVDEAHALGCFGPTGLGVCEEKGLVGEVDVIVGTFGKAVASAGAYAICAPEVRELMVNCSRSFIFSTALPPEQHLHTLTNLLKLRGAAERRERLHLLSDMLRVRIEETTGKEVASRSQIVPVVTGDPAKALELAERLRKKGILAMAIRRPTVPPGGDRLRLSLSALTRPEDLDRVVESL